MASDETPLDPDDLWTVVPAQFVEERDRTVRALRAAGDRVRAREVATWRRPTMVDWSLNLSAREAPGVVRGFVEAAHTAMAAQAAATSSSTGNAGPPLRAALADLRRAETELAAAAAEVALPVGGDQRASIATRLRELAGQAPLVDQLGRGCLGAPRGAAPDEDERIDPAAERTSASPAEVRTAQDTLQAARDAATQARREAAAAAKALREAEERANRALASQRSAEADVERLEAELAKARTRLEREERRSSEAEVVLDAARAQARAADEALAATARALAAAKQPGR